MTSSISIAIAIAAAATGCGGGYLAGRNAVAIATCNVPAQPTASTKADRDFFKYQYLPTTGGKNY
jgi:hypothetical protein